jgi:hypothetical protein
MATEKRLIELLQHSPTDAMGNRGVGAMADHLMDNGLVFKEMYDDIEERLAHQRVRATTAEHFICKLCAECDYEDNNGITTMILKCCSTFPECGKFKLRSDWIPVSERLPERGQEVIVASYRMIKPVVFTTTFWSKEYDNWYGITHWMPLPEPPKED